MKIGFIGCGKIAHFHANVLRELGVNIIAVSARENSPNIVPFTEKYHIPNQYTQWQEMVENESSGRPVGCGKLGPDGPASHSLDTNRNSTLPGKTGGPCHPKKSRKHFMYMRKQNNTFRWATTVAFTLS